MKWKQLVLALGGGAAAYVALAAHHLPFTLQELAQRFTDPVATARAELSGTRLKAKYVLGADGSQLFDPEVLHDSQLGVDCTFRNASDGALRCLPAVPDLDTQGNNWGQVLFTDAACANPFLWVVNAASGCTLTLPPYVYDYNAPPYCGLPTPTLPNARVYPVGAVMAAPVGVVYYYDGTTCHANGSLQGNRSAYTLAAEVAPATFATGTPGTSP